jgi:hypothetical protein
LAGLGYVPPPTVRTPPADFKVSPSQLITPQSGSILSTMIAPTSTPVFQSMTDTRSDPVMEKLLQTGYVIKSRVYQGQKVIYLLTKTRLGDKFFIQIDRAEYQNTFPVLSIPTNDITMTQTEKVINVPQETKIGVLNCLNLDVCGAAFVCDGSICFTKSSKLGQQVNFTEENFIYHTASSDFELSTGILGNSPLPYPIVAMSVVLAKPREVERLVETTSHNLHKIAYEQTLNRITVFEQEAEHLSKYAAKLRAFLVMSHDNLGSDITKLSTAFNNLESQPLSDATRPIYDTVIEGLYKKKWLWGSSIQAVRNAGNQVETLNIVDKTIQDMVNPTISKVAESFGKI